MQKTMVKFEQNPKKVFLIDVLGAILSAFLLGVVLVKFESFFGIPTSALYFLASIPIFFGIYDLYCYLKGNSISGSYFIGIAILNLLYCFISIGLAFYHSETITNLGWIYLIIEITVILILVRIELGVGKK